MILVQDSVEKLSNIDLHESCLCDHQPALESSIRHLVLWMRLNCCKLQNKNAQSNLINNRPRRPMPHSPYTLHSVAPFHSKNLPLTMGRSEPPANTPFLGVIRFTTPNNNAIESAVFSTMHAPYRRTDQPTESTTTELDQ